jgi:hypothetical protein
MQASATGATIVGFNAKMDKFVSMEAENKGVKVRLTARNDMTAHDCTETAYDCMTALHCDCTIVIAFISTHTKTKKQNLKAYYAKHHAIPCQTPCHAMP